MCMHCTEVLRRISWEEPETSYGAIIADITITWLKLNNKDILILYQDQELLIVDKPPGMMVHRNAWAPNAPTCVNSLAGILQRRVYNVHRLDRATSGVMLFALNAETAKLLADRFRDREVEKRYVAIVRGHLEEAITVDTPIRNKKGKEFHAVSHIAPLAKTVVPEPLGDYPEAWFSLVELDLETGRRHQARRHLNYISHPVIGDRQHGDRRNNRFFSDRFGCQELLLRAISLEFTHPLTGRLVRVFGGLPHWWREPLDRVGLKPPEGLLMAPGVTVIE